MIKTGVAGLGRLGKIHAINVKDKIEGMELTAVCSVNDKELEFAKNNLGIEKVFYSFEEMVDKGNLEAVIIVTPSGLHPSQIRYALEAGLHVFCEKPIGLEVDDILRTNDVITKHKKQIFFLGFMRRYDSSFQYAKKMVDNGEIGSISLVRAYGIDPGKNMDSFVKFAKESDSGGLFLDMSVHDIDLLRWYTGAEPKRMWALGNNKAYPELNDYGELELGSALIEMNDETMAFLVAGRNAPHGYHVELELMGTDGMIRVGNAPEKNLVTVYDSNGVVRPTSQEFPERFQEAFERELQAFYECILTGEQPEVTAEDGLEATKIALRLQEAYENNSIIEMD